MKSKTHSLLRYVIVAVAIAFVSGILYNINLGELLKLIALCVLVIALVVAFVLLFIDTR